MYLVNDAQIGGGEGTDEAAEGILLYSRSTVFSLKNVLSHQARLTSGIRAHLGHGYMEDGFEISTENAQTVSRTKYGLAAYASA